ncbi:MAG: hypothetical protein [Arizlama microvirus]|nr:MAG: hypothetical protein [Arizlama microvirus]
MTNIDHNTGEIRLDEYGQEIPDPNKLEVPLGMKRPPTLAEQVQRLVRTSLSEHAAMRGAETFAESEDFDFEDDDMEPWSPHEVELFNGFEVNANDFTDPTARGVERREALKKAYLAAERTRAQAEDFQDQVDEVFRTAKKTGRAAGQSAPAQKPAEPAPAEQSPSKP